MEVFQNLRRYNIRVEPAYMVDRSDANSGEYTFSLQWELFHRREGDVAGALPGQLEFGGRNFVEDFLIANDMMIELTQSMINYVINRQGLLPTDRMRMFFRENQYGIWASTPILAISDLDPDMIYQRIMEVAQSIDGLNLFRSQFIIQYFRLNIGGYGEWGDVTEFVKKKRCIISIQSNNNDCFFQCLALGLADDDEYRQLTKGRSYQRRREIAAQSLKDELNFSDTVTLSDIDAISAHFEIDILVIRFKGLEYLSHSKAKFNKEMYVLLIEPDDGTTGHFHYINRSRVGSLWDKTHFCKICGTGYWNARHKCIPSCLGCQRGIDDCEGAGKSRLSIYCQACHLYFFNEACFNFHTTNLCKKKKKCLRCKLVYWVKPGSVHRCYHRTCQLCKMEIDMKQEEQDGIHECFHQKITDLKPISTKYIYADFECTIDPETGLHEPSIIVAMTHESDEVFTFLDDGSGRVNQDFHKWLYRKHFKDYTLIAHNGGKYDFHFLSQTKMKNGVADEPGSTLMVGNRIMHTKAKKKHYGIRFIDSYNFIGTGLAKFPKTFNFPDISKGYFPYRFYTREHMHYIGPIPDISYFDVDRYKTEKELDDFMKWYKTQTNDINLQEMCLEYCIQDVKILKKGCSEFRRLFLDITEQKLDPFQYITIASVCMAIYQYFDMPPDSIASLNEPEDYRWEQEWLLDQGVSDFFHESLNGHRCALKDNIYYTYKLCRDIGCNRCYKKMSKHPNGQLFYVHEKMWESELQTLKQIYTDVKVMTPCQWRILRRKKKFDNIPEERLRLNIRDAFFGGRTEPIKLYKKVEEGEKICYGDFTSLYPTVQFCKMNGITPETCGEKIITHYPIGHPTYIRENFDSLENYFGFVKCVVEPPDNLPYIPVLPEKRDGKLFFDNRVKCGTWSIDEVIAAKRLGYKVTKIYEVAHFKQKSDNLFKSYVMRFLKIKQEAAGWPEGCDTDEKRDKYLKDYMDEMGIALCADNIREEKNHGLYFIAKICLNSLWGKYGQRRSFNKTLTTYNHEQFSSIIFNDEFEVVDVRMHDPTTRTIVYKQKEELIELSRNTNIAICAQTTALARLRLLEFLYTVGPENVLYMDTDSCIYVQKQGENKICTGNYLGDITNELEGDDYITDYVCTGPKSYAYKTKSGSLHDCLKLKGFTLDNRTKEKITFDAMVEMAHNRLASITTQPLQFNINHDHEIKTKKWEGDSGKVYRYTFDKRNVLAKTTENIIDSLPWN